MKRFLYLFLAATISGIASPAVPDDVNDMDEVEEAASPTAVSVDERDRRGTQSAMVAVQPLEDGFHSSWGTAARRSLVVDHNQDRNIASVRGVRPGLSPDRVASRQLIEAVLRDATHRGDLKIQIDTALLPLHDLESICRDQHFMYWRTVMHRRRHVHEFIADLYSAQRE